MSDKQIPLWEVQRPFLFLFLYPQLNPQPESVIPPPVDGQKEDAKAEESRENQHTEAQDKDSSPEDKTSEEAEHGSDEHPKEKRQNYKMAFVKPL